jgi:hypothetical protein
MPVSVLKFLVEASSLAAKFTASPITESGIEPTIYSSFTKDQLKDIKSVELDKIKVKGKDELITIYKPVI